MNSVSSLALEVLQTKGTLLLPGEGTLGLVEDRGRQRGAELLVVEGEGDLLREGEGDRQMEAEMVCPTVFLLEAEEDLLKDPEGDLLMEVEQGICLEAFQTEKSL